ncbi:MAG: polysaccharide deacetylase family protein [Candidatus Krumholzibacteria bacterium]|nr:polysaccharide deacetylase family protein [Candidatus Krumholzibacteria bacterium]
MTKRHALGHLLAAIPPGMTRSLRLAHRGRYLTVLCYHRILERGADFPFDDDLVSASPAQFESELRFIARHWRTIDFRMLRDHVAREGRFPDRSLIITFDDGYLDNYEVAYPLLRKYDLPAVMFVTAGYMGKRRLFWWDRLAYVAKTASKRSASIEEPIRLSIDLDSFPGRQDAARHLIHTAKTLPDGDKELFIRRLAASFEVEIDESRFATTMGWSDLREMSAGGIEIGAHSISHPIFSNIDGDLLAHEVSQSKAVIEKELGREVISFGSPGRGRILDEEKERFEKTLRDLVVSSGYSFSTMYQWGLVYENEFDAFRIRRIGIESYDTPPVFRAKLSYPELMSY